MRIFQYIKLFLCLMPVVFMVSFGAFSSSVFGAEKLEVLPSGKETYKPKQPKSSYQSGYSSYLLKKEKKETLHQSRKSISALKSQVERSRLSLELRGKPAAKSRDKSAAKRETKKRLSHFR